MTRVLWRQPPVTQAYLALSEVLGHLDVLARDGLVREAERGGIVTWIPARPPVRAARAAA
jgi:hypothetical protein